MSSSFTSKALTLRFSRPAASALLAATIVLLVGCDRQKPAEPQASAAAGPVASQAAPRYRIDRSGAGTPLPAAALTARGGERATLSALSGKPVLVNLWATWCAPCVEELPTLNRLASEMVGRGHVIALSQDLNQDPVPVHAFLDERGWSEIESWHDPENAVGLAFGGQLPTTILFGADGREVLRVIGPMDWYGAEAAALLREAGFVRAG